jgi:hypothetical protein
VLGWPGRPRGAVLLPGTGGETVTDFAAYRAAIEAELRVGRATEHTHRPALKNLLESVVAGVTATNEPTRVACGAPDFLITTASASGPLIVGYVEAKDVGTALDGVEDTEQLHRYLRSLENLLLTDYLEFRWYVNGEHRQTARLGGVVGGAVAFDRAAERLVDEVLSAFLGRTPEPVRDPLQLAERLAQIAHLVRDVIVIAFEQEAASDQLRALYQAFDTVLLPDLDVSEFADMFAQTLVHGLFAARVVHIGDEPFRRHAAAHEIPRENPFLRQLFAAIAGPQLDDEPFAVFVDDAVQLLAAADMESVLGGFAGGRGQLDPLIHFYETFLAAYDPKLREARGVYYTPEPVVRFIVEGVNQVLETRFRCPRGLADSRSEDDASVLILDPACGTGTFLHGVIDHIRSGFIDRDDAGRWQPYVAENLIPRLFGFELLMAPYTVAHLKLMLTLAGHDLAAQEKGRWGYAGAADRRLNVFLTNTLEEAIQRSDLLLGRYISDEANAAAVVKRDLPIMVVLGNPPYSGHSSNRGDWIRDLLDDYFRIDGEPLHERQQKWLQDDYVKFIRFGQWRIDQTGVGVLAFITNHSYLDNTTFRAMRRSLMRSFTSIHVLNLHGNSRRREKAPDGLSNENVFDIQQGVAITFFVREPDPRNGDCRVLYADVWGTRGEKNAFLEAETLDTIEWEEVQPAAPYFFFKAVDNELLDEYNGGWGLDELMPHHGVGFVTGRDRFAVAFNRDELVERIREFRDPRVAADLLSDRYGLADTDNWSIAEARQAIRDDAEWEAQIFECVYRPFDRRFVFLHDAVAVRPVWPTQRHLTRGGNLALLAPRQMEGDFHHAFVSTVPTNFNNLDTAGVLGTGYVFPLELLPSEAELAMGLYEADHRDSNVAPQAVAAVSESLGRGVTPREIVAYSYGLLHSRAYRERYAPLLHRGFPRVHFSTDDEVFAELARIGEELVGLHTMRSPRLRDQMLTFPVVGPNTITRRPRYVAPGEAPHPDEPAAMHGRVYISDTRPRLGTQAQFFEGVPDEVWAFHVGGYQVCERWLNDRRGRLLSASDLDHYERLCIAVRETIRLMDDIDDLVVAWPLE